MSIDFSLYITKEDAAKLLNTTEETVRKRYDRGQLKGRVIRGVTYLYRREICIMSVMQTQMTIRDVAEYLDVSVATLYRWDASPSKDVLHSAYKSQNVNYYLTAEVQAFAQTHPKQTKKEGMTNDRRKQVSAS